MKIPQDKNQIARLAEILCLLVVATGISNLTRNRYRRAFSLFVVGYSFFMCFEQLTTNN